MEQKTLDNNYIIEMRNITKKFPGIIANDNITLTLKKGEIHALLGENGAGKSTLMSVLFGMYQPEEGAIYKNGEKVIINDPNDATALGIGMVHQHFKLVECFNVLDNVILGAEPFKQFDLTNYLYLKIKHLKKEFIKSKKEFISSLVLEKNEKIAAFKKQIKEIGNATGAEEKINQLKASIVSVKTEYKNTKKQKIEEKEKELNEKLLKDIENLKQEFVNKLKECEEKVKTVQGEEESLKANKELKLQKKYSNIGLGRFKYCINKFTNTVFGLIAKKVAEKRLIELSNKYDLKVEPRAIISDITVGMQQRTEILKMLYRDNEILIFDEPTAVLTPQEIEELMKIMMNLKNEGKSILFISHKLNEIMAVSDRCSVLRKGKYIGTVNVKDTTKEQLSSMMVGRDVEFVVKKKESTPTDVMFETKNITVKGKGKKNAVHNVSIKVRKGEVVCVAGIDGNGQTEFVQAITGLIKPLSGEVFLNGENITNKPIRYRNTHGLSHIPEDRHKHGLILDYTLAQNMVLQRYFEPQFQKHGFIKQDEVVKYSDMLIENFDVRSGQGSKTIARSMSGGNQQKAIIAREMDRNHDLLIAVQPTRGLDVGAIEGIHSKIIAERDAGKAVLLVSLELEEVMNVSDRIYVMYEGEIVGILDPKKITVQELGLYMSGAKRDTITEDML